MSNRSIVYIDGYNFYYGAVYQSPHKWLNLESLFKSLRQDDIIQNIYYFTALLDNNPARMANQREYLGALQTCSLLKIIYGKYKPREKTCTVPHCTHHTRIFHTYEEKRTDVNIAIQVLSDVYENKCDRIVIISGDSDLVPVIHKAKELRPDKKITVYVPHRDSRRGAAVEIRSVADKHKSFPLNMLPLHQFPNQVSDTQERLWNKPSSW